MLNELYYYFPWRKKTDTRQNSVQLILLTGTETDLDNIHPSLTSSLLDLLIAAKNLPSSNLLKFVVKVIKFLKIWNKISKQKFSNLKWL